MKHGVYLISGSDTNYLGVNQKVSNQIKAFSKTFNIIKVVLEKEATNPIKSVMWRLPFGSWGANYQKAIENIGSKVLDNEVAFFYIRLRPLDRRFLKFIKKIRYMYPNARIVCEIGTYPYDGELLQDKTMWPWFFKDHIYRYKLKKYVDRIVTFSDDKEIFGIPTINVRNGISVDEIFIKSDEEIGRNDNNEINLLAVAQFQKTHGYERAIKGMSEYYRNNPKKKIILHMVGEGKEKKYYERLVLKYDLTDYVKFYGLKRKDELQPFYQNADIALGAFGGYKRRVRISSALKIREYLAYGIPVVSGMYEDAFEDETCKFYLQFPNDSTVVSIDRIVDFYDKLYGQYSVKELRKLIHEYAKTHLDMSVTMRPVIDYLIQ